MGTLVFPSMTLDPMPSPHGYLAFWQIPLQTWTAFCLPWPSLVGAPHTLSPGSQCHFLWSRDFSASWRMYLLGEPVRHRLHMSLRAILRAFRSFSLCRGLQSMRAYGRVFSNLDA